MIEWIVSSSILILIVAVLRACFKGKLSLRLQYGIWGLVLLRLLIPVSFGSTDFSVENLTDTVQSQPAIQAITDVGKVSIPSQSYEAAYHQVVQEYEAAGIDVDSLQGSDLEALEYEAYDRMQGKTVSQIVSDILCGIWVAGILVTGTVFAAVNVRFHKKLLASRCELQLEKNHLRVYATDQIDTPCLFGIRKPAIYVTPSVAEDETLLRHTLEHEATHYRHGDHIWAILRCVCLAVHWYNPLVWWAAFLSRQDGELACDEATIQALGEEERAEYGRTLIGMTCQKKSNVLVTATTMAMGKGGLRERIVLIAKKPRMALYTLLIVVVAAAVAVGCTFTGAKDEEPDLTQTQPQITESTEPTQETQSTETKPIETEPLETVSFEDLVEVPDTLYEEPVHGRVCIAVQPTGKVASGEEELYIIPENQEALLKYYLAATDTAHTYTQRDSGDPLTGWRIEYRGEMWQVTESGAMYGWRAQKNVVIDASDAKALYRFCDATVRAAGIGEPVRPGDIGKLKSATLYWNGEHTVTYRYALNEIESWFSNARELTGGAMCWFTAQLVLEMENGETKAVAIATDDCAAYMSEGAFYSFGEITHDGIEDNTEFYSLFAPDLIREKSKEGMDAVKPYLRYLNWGRYSNQFNDPREIFALMRMIENWAAEEPTYKRFGSVIAWSDGLDGAYADAYSGMLCRLYELAPAEFAWACMGNATDEKEANTLFLMAYNWNLSVEEVREKLNQDLSKE